MPWCRLGTSAREEAKPAPGYKSSGICGLHPPSALIRSPRNTAVAPTHVSVSSSSTSSVASIARLPVVTYQRILPDLRPLDLPTKRCSINDEQSLFQTDLRPWSHAASVPTTVGVTSCPPPDLGQLASSRYFGCAGHWPQPESIGFLACRQAMAINARREFHWQARTVCTAAGGECMHL